MKRFNYIDFTKSKGNFEAGENTMSLYELQRTIVQIEKLGKQYPKHYMSIGDKVDNLRTQRNLLWFSFLLCLGASLYFLKTSTSTMDIYMIYLFSFLSAISLILSFVKVFSLRNLIEYKDLIYEDYNKLHKEMKQKEAEIVDQINTNWNAKIENFLKKEEAPQSIIKTICADKTRAYE